MGFYFGLAYVFLRFSMAQESLTLLVHLNLYLALLTGAPAVILSLVGGGFHRAIQSATGKCWMVFIALMIASLPFSSWIGSSVGLFMGYIRADFPILFIIGGMILTWKEFKMLMGALAISGACTLAMERFFASQDDGRLGLAGGSISNANDYAAHVLMLLPFLLWVVLTPCARIYKAFSLGLLCVGLFFVLKTGSRGALIAIGVGFLAVLLRGPGKLRWILGIVGPVAVIASFSFLPASVLFRFANVVSNQTTVTAAAEDTTGALESGEQRRYLLKKSIQFTFEHPIFGVGLGDFATFEGGTRAQTKHGQWQQTHNSFTQVSSEMGIPAAVGYVGAVLCALFSLSRVMSRGKRDKIPILVVTAFMCMLSIVMMTTCMAFLSLAYRFYLPALTALAIALERISRMEFAGPAAAASVPAFARTRTPVARLQQSRFAREGFRA